jgi:hypothetical protein
MAKRNIWTSDSGACIMALTARDKLLTAVTSRAALSSRMVTLRPFPDFISNLEEWLDDLEKEAVIAFLSEKRVQAKVFDFFSKTHGSNQGELLLHDLKLMVKR